MNRIFPYLDSVHMLIGEMFCMLESYEGTDYNEIEQKAIRKFLYTFVKLTKLKDTLTEQEE